MQIYCSKWSYQPYCWQEPYRSIKRAVWYSASSLIRGRQAWGTLFWFSSDGGSGVNRSCNFIRVGEMLSTQAKSSLGWIKYVKTEKVTVGFRLSTGSRRDNRICVSDWPLQSHYSPDVTCRPGCSITRDEYTPVPTGAGRSPVTRQLTWVIVPVAYPTDFRTSVVFCT